MLKRTDAAIALAAYGAILIKVMVFKDLPTIRVGRLMLNMGGTEAGNAPNLIPFSTIVPYLFGHKGLIIAGVNLIGNIVLLVPVGLLLPLVYRSLHWRTSLICGIVIGFSIEVSQVLLRIGTFDIDDVILNALGVVIGYGIFSILAKTVRSRQ